MNVSGRAWLWLVIPLLLGLIALGWWRAALTARVTRRELVELRQRRERLEQANRALTREVEALKHEREERALAARKVLAVAAPGEILVLVPPSATPSVTPTMGAQ